MKRFWIEEIILLLLCSQNQRTLKMSTRKSPSSSVHLVLFILVFIQIVVPSYCIVNKNCSASHLHPCDENEICFVDETGNGVCKCLEGFKPNTDTGKCEKPSPTPEPPRSHLGLSLGLSLTFFLVLVVIILTVLHYKFGLLAGMCDGLPRLRLFGRSRQDFNMVDNEDDDDDVNPIV